jgi:hypothetical protein
MDSAAPCPTLDAAFEEIEGAVLPSLCVLLDNLLDAAALALPGVDAERHAAELRRLGLQVADLTARIEAVAPVPAQAPARLRMSA